MTRLLNTLVLALVIGLGAHQSSAAPTEVSDPAARKIQSFYSTLLDTMKRGSQLGMKGRFQALAPAVDSTFDLPVMIKFIVGPGWSTMSEEDHKLLTEAFRKMTVANYASNFDSFGGQQFNVDPNVLTRGTDRFVQSTLVPKSGNSVPFVYRMRATGSDWKAIDIYLNGNISELTTRRSDFASTLASGGAAALVKKLNDLADNSLSGAKATSG